MRQTILAASAMPNTAPSFIDGPFFIGLAGFVLVLLACIVSIVAMNKARTGDWLANLKIGGAALIAMVIFAAAVGGIFWTIAAAGLSDVTA